MPRVEKELVPDGGFRNFDYLGVPRDAVNPRLIVEWDDPKNDWTPKDVALHLCKHWMVEDIANKIAELERAKNAEIVEEMKKGVPTSSMSGFMLEGALQKILARTNENAGYPRMGE